MESCDRCPQRFAQFQLGEGTDLVAKGLRCRIKS
ncbi:hypothetical protein ETAA8_25490 [Anatilimnocola aggregata]|uniref:Uncharacterized protein n=1 Tax=Anatilimnocola aggregata TaxID=2528021 RepID=A0A517YB80_9BACT|nr:hypothetical protein ETAA8_25490 [Anatilimnocola aggregata]